MKTVEHKPEAVSPADHRHDPKLKLSADDLVIQVADVSHSQTAARPVRHIRQVA